MIVSEKVFVVACGAVSPWGTGIRAVGEGLMNARPATTRRAFPEIGELSVGVCDDVPSIVGEDRGTTLARAALAEIEPIIGELNRVVAPERRGVCAATSKLGLMLYIENPDLAAERFNELMPDWIARVIAQKIDARGPLQGIVAACATGLQNICRGAEWVADGNADYVIAGGSEAALTPLYLCSLLNLGAMARDESHPFDKRHEGFLAGEGAGLVVLANEKTVKKLGRKPIAVMRGWAMAGEAFHATSMDTSGRVLAGLLKKTLNYSKCDASEINLLGVHGTGTVQSDMAEANALRDVYAGITMPPILGVKGAIGHLMGACGAVEFAAALECLRLQIAPAAVGFETAVEGCEHLIIPRKTRSANMRRILKWNSGFGGQMAACVIEKPDY